MGLPKLITGSLHLSKSCESLLLNKINNYCKTKTSIFMLCSSVFQKQKFNISFYIDANCSEMALLVPFPCGTRSSPVCQLVFFFVRETREMCVLVVLDQFWKITFTKLKEHFFFFFFKKFKNTEQEIFACWCRIPGSGISFNSNHSQIFFFFWGTTTETKLLKCFSFVNHTINFKWLKILLVSFFFVFVFGMYFYFYLITYLFILTYFIRYLFMYLNNFQETLQLQSNTFEINWFKKKLMTLLFLMISAIFQCKVLKKTFLKKFSWYWNFFNKTQGKYLSIRNFETQWAAKR